MVKVKFVVSDSGVSFNTWIEARIYELLNSGPISISSAQRSDLAIYLAAHLRVKRNTNATHN